MQQDALQRVVRQMNAFGRAREPFFFLFDFDLKSPRTWSLKSLSADELRFSTTNFPESGATLPDYEESVLQFSKYPIPYTHYQTSFDLVMGHLKRGNSFLVNLSAPTPIQTNLSLLALYERCQAKYRIWFRDEFVCFSPETFIQIHKNVLSSFPMKGTIDGQVANAERTILEDKKEAAEHATIVDLIRNDVSMVAHKVWVERYRYLDRLETNQKTLLQVSSQVCGLLNADWHEYIGDLILKLLPAGSITGAPKPKTVAIIKEVEGYERGYYTGVAGVFDGENLDSGVLIRFVEKTDSGLIFKSGGGITARSVAELEYQELIDKVYLPIPTNALLRDHPS